MRVRWTPALFRWTSAAKAPSLALMETVHAGRQVGERIAVARKTAGLSQRALGKRLGISAQQVEALEGGRSDPSSYIDRVAEVTRRSSDWLLTGAEAAGDDDAMTQALERRVIEAREPDEQPADERGVLEDQSLAKEDEPDELDRLVTGLRQQRDEIKRRLTELDDREHDLQVRESILAGREDLIRVQQAKFERESEARLQELEELHRRVVESGSAFAERAAELRQSRMDAAEKLSEDEQQPAEPEQEAARNS
jgi:transcriptional regulator with XRE-family HTH domain